MIVFLILPITLNVLSKYLLFFHTAEAPHWGKAAIMKATESKYTLYNFLISLRYNSIIEHAQKDMKVVS